MKLTELIFKQALDKCFNSITDNQEEALRAIYPNLDSY